MSDQNTQLNTIETAYLYKKTEKLVSALYLISNFLSDKEPIKWQLRELGVSLLSAPDMSVILANQILSLLQVAHIGGLITEMNFSILKFEFESLIQQIEQEEKERMKGHILSEDFFNIPKNISAPEHNIPKGHDVMSNRMSIKKSAENVRPSELKQKDKSNRQDIIIALLKKGGELGIKDFTTSIKDCSEKTIQRELVTLVSKGQIKKAGEKRWSRYSLK